MNPYFLNLSQVLAKLTSKNQLTLPKSVTQALGPVQYFEVQTKAGQIILTPVKIQRGDALRAKLAELAIDEKTIESALSWAEADKKAPLKKTPAKKTAGQKTVTEKAAAPKPSAKPRRAKTVEKTAEKTTEKKSASKTPLAAKKTPSKKTVTKSGENRKASSRPQQAKST